MASSTGPLRPPIQPRLRSGQDTWILKWRSSQRTRSPRGSLHSRVVRLGFLAAQVVVHSADKEQYHHRLDRGRTHFQATYVVDTWLRRFRRLTPHRSAQRSRSYAALAASSDGSFWSPGDCALDAETMCHFKSGSVAPGLSLEPSKKMVERRRPTGVSRHYQWPCRSDLLGFEPIEDHQLRADPIHRVFSVSIQPTVTEHIIIACIKYFICFLPLYALHRTRRAPTEDLQKKKSRRLQRCVGYIPRRRVENSCVRARGWWCFW